MPLGRRVGFWGGWLVVTVFALLEPGELSPEMRPAMLP